MGAFFYGNLHIKLNIESHEIFCVLTLLWILNPVSDQLNAISFVVLTFIWMLMAFIMNRDIFLKCIIDKLFVASCLYPAFLLIYSVRPEVQFEKKSIIDPIIVLIFLFYRKKNNRRAENRITGVVLVYIVMTSIVTIIKLCIDPKIARLMAGDHTSSFASPFTGGYGTVYCVMLLSIAFVGLLLNKMVIRTKKKKLLILTALFLVFIIMSQYVMALFLLWIGMIRLVIDRKRIVKVIVPFAIAATFLLITAQLLDISAILMSISYHVPGNSYLHTRLVQMSDLLTNIMNGKYSSITSLGTFDRYDIYMISINSFKDNWLWGIGNCKIRSIANHSTILDVLAGLGIILGGIYIISRIYLFLKIRNTMGKIHRGIYSSVMVVYLLFMLLNSAMGSEFTLIMFLIIPFVFQSTYGTLYG